MSRGFFRNFKKIFRPETGRGNPRPIASAHVVDHVVHRLVHRRAQLVDALIHLLLHGPAAALGGHHPRHRAGGHAGADAQEKSGALLHLHSLLFRAPTVCPPETKKSPGPFAKARQTRYTMENEFFQEELP